MREKLLNEIKGFEDCRGYVIHENGSVYSERSKGMMKLCTDSKGYKYIDLRRFNPTTKLPKVHKLVMLAFSNTPPKEQINHIDGNKNNNSFSNLEYVTNKENREHAIKNSLMKGMSYGINQYDKSGKFIATYNTAYEAMTAIGVQSKNSGNIGRVVSGKRKTAYGFIWKQQKGSTTIPDGSTL